MRRKGPLSTSTAISGGSTLDTGTTDSSGISRSTASTTSSFSARVTLHVGLGTFAPVKVADPAKHEIHREWCEVTQPAVDAVLGAKARGGRVVAVGTTSTRTLESAARPDGLRPFCGETGLYVRPPFEFRVVDALVTNFHLPRTTLLLLVGALAGPDLLRAAYAEAVARLFNLGSSTSDGEGDTEQPAAGNVAAFPSMPHEPRGPR